IEDEYIEKNPCKFIKVRIPEKTPKFFTKEDFDKFIKAVDNEDLKDLYIFAVNTGLRLGELRNLTWSNVIDSKIVLDNHSHLTKTDKVRVIPLNKIAQTIFNKRFDTNKVKTKYMFTFRGFKLTEDNATHKLKKYIMKVGINEKLNFHSLRHTFASWLVQNGVNIYNVSKLLGHANIKTTEIYAHLRAEDLRESVEMLN
ncbi:MAG: site-specific integrase, partial [Ignavibacteriae bacterium]|nr:site-specific integrase [Ignavibacteriota bacterium]